MKKSHYIKLLEYGEERGIKGVDFDEVVIWAISNEIIPETGTKEHDSARGALKDIFFECFKRVTDTRNNLHTLKTEYFYRLIEFKELQESRIASTQANRNSFIAISISIVAILIAVIISYIQLTGSVLISPAQIKELVNANTLPIHGSVTIKPSQINTLSSKLDILINEAKISNKIINKDNSLNGQKTPIE